MHGRQAALVDYAATGYYQYGEVEGVSDELRRLWNRIYRANHLSDPLKDITTIQISDSNGRYRIEISVPQCAML